MVEAIDLLHFDNRQGRDGLGKQKFRITIIQTAPSSNRITQTHAIVMFIFNVD